MLTQNRRFIAVFLMILHYFNFTKVAFHYNSYCSLRTKNSKRTSYSNCKSEIVFRQNFSKHIKSRWQLFFKISLSVAGICCDLGSHVAGTAASPSFGVAKKAQVFSVCIFPGDPNVVRIPPPGTTTAAMLAGLQKAGEVARTRPNMRFVVKYVQSRGEVFLFFYVFVCTGIAFGAQF